MKKRMFGITVCFCLAIILAVLLITPAFAKVIELNIADNNPEMSPPGQATKFWAEQAAKLSGGKVNGTVHFGGALLKGDEVYRGVQSGIADAGLYTLDRQDGFILNTIIPLPFMGWPKQAETREMYKKLLKKFSKMTNEWENIIVTGIMMMPPTHIHTSKKQVRTPGDLKGLKLHGAEQALIRTLAAAGGTPIELDIGDMYMSLDRGLIGGVMNHIPVLDVFGVLELLPNHTMFGEGGMNMTPMFIIMNAEKFNSFPPDVQKAIMGAGKAWEDHMLELDLAYQVEVTNKAKEMNHTFINLTPAEMDQWYKVVKGSVHDTWLKQAEDKGLPGKAVYDAALQMIKEGKM